MRSFPLLVELAGLPGALVITGLVLPVVAAVTFVASAGPSAPPSSPSASFRRCAGCRCSPLPLTALEQLARSLEPVSSERDRVITQGDPEIAFTHRVGTVAIIHDGHQTTLGAGDGFGEIALLSDRPRTATVDVTDPMTGYRLPRDAFLEAVTGSPHSVIATDELMARRLAEMRH